ncbi:MAG: lipase [Tannerella sp.]|jgi:hypothetical protein|nr:lipase [Tannerella sp.]
MKIRLLLLFLFLTCGAVFAQNDSIRLMEYLPVGHTDSKPWIERYQNEINRYTDENRQSADLNCDALFLGSSSIQKWDSIYWDLSPLKILRRSYGGASIRDMLYNYDVIARGYRPKSIVLYVENDLCECPDEITEYETFDLIRIFTQRIRRDYPETPFFIISFKPSFAREKALNKQKIVNYLLRSFAENTPNVYFIDITPGMYDSDGNLRKDIFLPDNLHINRKGYAIWTSVIKPVLMEKLYPGADPSGRY